MKPKLTIAADAPHTAHAGLEVAQAGGNAADVAVAAALAAMISEVLMCSLGGAGFVMIKQPGQDAELIDGADAMPADCSNPSIREEHLAYGDGISVQVGHGSVAVPGCLAALELAWKRHGSLPWKDILAPALAIADQPVPAGPTLGKWLELAGRQIFYQQPASRRCFFPNDRALIEGQEHVLPYMADTLEHIAREGAAALYQGELGALFAREMADNGGLVTRKDLSIYEAQIRKPLLLSSAGYTIATNPPPSVGGTGLGLMLQLVESGWHSASSDAEKTRLIADAQATLLRIKNSDKWMPPFSVTEAQQYLDIEFLKQYANGIHSAHTTHLSVATSDGAAVAITMSNGYGSGVTIPGTGICCNNSLGEPELNPGGYFQLPAGSRLVSNMAPTVASHPDGHVLAIGSPGASRITTAILQTWVQYGLEGHHLQRAIHHPRLHVEQWPEGIRALCEPGLDGSKLENYRVREFDALDMFFGAVKACAVDNAGNLEAVADNRRHGSVVFT